MNQEPGGDKEILKLVTQQEKQEENDLRMSFFFTIAIFCLHSLPRCLMLLVGERRRLERQQKLAEQGRRIWLGRFCACGASSNGKVLPPLVSRVCQFVID